MKAMILAAGRGDRMRPLTDSIPKPLLQIRGKSLIEYRLDSLRAAGIRECIINLSYLGSQIREHLGDGSRWGMLIHYSEEGDRPLESAGGIVHALPLLGDNPFILTNADVWTDFDFNKLPNTVIDYAYLIMVKNPPHNATGDFYYKDGKLRERGGRKLTYSGIGVYKPDMFRNCTPGRQQLKPLLLQAISQNKVSAEYYKGIWTDIGTLDRLSQIEQSGGLI